MHGCGGDGGTCTAVTGKGARKGKSGEGARGGLMEGQLVEAITAAAQLHAAQLVLHPGISCAQRGTACKARTRLPPSGVSHTCGGLRAALSQVACWSGPSMPLKP